MASRYPPPARAGAPRPTYPPGVERAVPRALSPVAQRMIALREAARRAQRERDS